MSQGQIGAFLPIAELFGILCSLDGEGNLIPMIDSEASFPLKIPFCPGTDWNPDFIKLSGSGILLNISLIHNEEV